MAEADLASTASGPPQLVGLHGEWALAASEPMHEYLVFMFYINNTSLAKEIYHCRTVNVCY